MLYRMTNNIQKGEKNSKDKIWKKLTEVKMFKTSRITCQ